MRRATLALGAAVLLAACDRTANNFAGMAPTLDQQVRTQFSRWGVAPIGAEPAQDSNQVKLGRLLFFDPVLSGNRDRACASCHNPATAMADARSIAVGTEGRLAVRSAPSLLGVGLGLFQLFWDGRLQSSGGGDLLVRQVTFPVVNRIEMRGDSALDGPANELATIADWDTAGIQAAVTARLMAIPAYRALFDAAFGPAQHGFPQAAQAIGAFEVAALARTHSAFDRYLAGEDGALSFDQKQGALLFFGTAKCSQCHSGALLGGNGGFANTGAPQIGVALDTGRAGVPGCCGANPFDRFSFRIPALRNVELTAPYFHDGAYPTLAAVVKHYNDVRTALATYDPANVAPELRPLIHGDAATIAAQTQTLAYQLQQPLGLTAAQQAQLVAFLQSLSDPAARDLSALRPASVPSGLPVP